MHRLILVSLLSALVLAAPASAQDAPTITFRQAPLAPGTNAGPSTWYVDATADVPFNGAYVELIRNGVDQSDRLATPVTDADGGTVTEWMPFGLDRGDVARFYSSPGHLVASATFTQQPSFSAVCVGGSMFGVLGFGPILYAGAAPAGAYPFDVTSRGLLSANHLPSGPEMRVVTLSRPIEAGGVVFAATGGLDPSGTKVVTEGSANVSAFVPCSPLVDPVMDPPAPPAPTPTPTPAALTDGEVKFFVKTSAGKVAAALRRRTTPTKVTFAVPEAGTLTLRLSSRGKTLANGTSTLPGAARAAVSLKRTVAGRRLLANHGKPLRLTLTATFAPARSGAKAQRASVTVTRKG